MPDFTYTIHSVAWPTLPMRDGIVDEVNVLVDYMDITLSLYRFDSSNKGVKLGIFGDALKALDHPGFQAFLALWRNTSTPDDCDAWALGRMLRHAGAVPSGHMPKAERDEHDDEHVGGPRGVSQAKPESCSICGHEAERQMERSIVTW